MGTVAPTPLQLAQEPGAGSWGNDKRDKTDRIPSLLPPSRAAIWDDYLEPTRCGDNVLLPHRAGGSGCLRPRSSITFDLQRHHMFPFLPDLKREPTPKASAVSTRCEIHSPFHPPPTPLGCKEEFGNILETPALNLEARQDFAPSASAPALWFSLEPLLRYLLPRRLRVTQCHPTRGLHGSCA